MNTPSDKNASSSKVSPARAEFGWGGALRFIGNGLGLRGKNRLPLDAKSRGRHARAAVLDVGASSREIALHLLRHYRVRQAVEETLEGLVYLIDDLKGIDELAAQDALGEMLAGSVSGGIQYYRLCAENKATYGESMCRIASDCFVNEAILTFMRNLPAALKAGLLATQTDPSYQRAWDVYGTLQMCCGQFTAAEQSFARAQALAA